MYIIIHFYVQVGETVLMYACKMEDLNSVKMLLKRNANPNTVSEVSTKNICAFKMCLMSVCMIHLFQCFFKGKETALLFAMQRKEVKISEELLNAGADPNFRTEV